MRNLLFVSSNDINPLNGGIDRVIDVLAGEFSRHPEYNCFLAYFQDLPGSSTAFKKKMKIDRKHAEQTCRDFIVANHIHIILVNILVASNFKFILPILYAIAKEQALCKIVFVYHNQPGFEKEKMKIDVYLHRIFRGKDRVSNLKNLAIQIITGFCGEKTVRKCFREKYRLIYRYSDKIVLLAPSHFPLFAFCADIPVDDKLVAIGNFLSFPAAIGKDEIKEKDKTVLIVSRMEEKQKRISLALKIWENIEKLNIHQEWKLIILGSGIDETYYRKTAEKKQLKRVSFEGAHLPEAWYRKSSIFMMTSAYEGFPLILTESLQMGVLPVAFDSFSALHDIITDGYNGFIIPNNDITAYTNQLLQLMDSEEQRLSIARNAIDSSKTFELSGIVEQWFGLFNELFQTK
ncbi:MAG: glycosyltransferase [Dysgonamonadaceae bacterium]|jgi:glycosyltransferase involved in cell wall biosynthesis|nr:glycosyltransferase [Dysgonamonadaceae bacterium]